MPRSLTCLLAVLGCAAGAFAADVTVVMEFDGPHSERSIQQMKHETEDIVRDSGLHLDWRTTGGAASFLNVVMVRFTGNCMLDPEGTAAGEGGPLAFTYNSDGKMLHFSEVACNRVAAALRPAMWGDDFQRADYLMGRAMGRVLAHELVHILTGSGAHGQEGVAQPALSGGQLIGAPLRLSRDDLQRLRRGLAGQ